MCEIKADRVFMPPNPRIPAEAFVSSITLYLPFTTLIHPNHPPDPQAQITVRLGILLNNLLHLPDNPSYTSYTRSPARDSAGFGSLGKLCILRRISLIVTAGFQPSSSSMRMLSRMGAGGVDVWMGEWWCEPPRASFC